MSGFKLLAIRPLKDCSPHFYKLLQVSEIYPFYREYKFLDSHGQIILGDEDVCSIIPNDNSEPKLYEINGNNKIINVNISAVVGKNGSGKSTLIEFLYYSIYYLGNCIRLENGENLLKTYEEILESEVNYVIKRELNSTNSLEIQTKLDKLYKKQKAAKENHELICNGFKASIFYQYDDKFYELRIDDQKVSNSELNQINLQKQSKLSPEILKDIFYTISINYSHHSLNALEIGGWINTLFHKNDGYKTPAVINPMREDGNFNINAENNFAKQRLLANAIIEYLSLPIDKKEVYLSDHQYIKYLKFTFKTDKEVIQYIKLGNREYTANSPMDAELYEKLYSLFFEGFDQISLHTNSLPFQQIVANYTLQKVYKILEGYPEYDLIKRPDSDIEVNKYAEEIVKIFNDDNSHVVFKLKQSLNFMRNNYLLGSSSKWANEKETVYLTLDEFVTWMDLKPDAHIKLVYEKIPPTLFEVDFVLSDSSAQNDPELLPTFNGLSSGERQFIHSIQSVLYHINNLESVHNKSKFVSRITFNKINLVFDEIELYFHPDLQRRFISTLLTRIQRLNLEHVNGINILFATHSPFILSDIPVSNILKLTNDGPYPYEQEKQTFGANVHDLLANDFFMKEGFMGEWAKNKITDTLNFLHYHKVKKEVDAENPNEDFHTAKQRELKIFKLKLNELDPLKHLELIQLIGEPVLKRKLLEKYNALFDPINVMDIRSEIERLARQIGYDVKLTKES